LIRLRILRASDANVKDEGGANQHGESQRWLEKKSSGWAYPPGRSMHLLSFPLLQFPKEFALAPFHPPSEAREACPRQFLWQS
jgi:hypothetical protein